MLRYIGTLKMPSLKDKYDILRPTVYFNESKLREKSQSFCFSYHTDHLETDPFQLF